MKRSRFPDEQTIGARREHQAGLTASESCRKPGISDATVYTWRKEYGGMKVSEAKRLKALEEGECAPEEASGGVDDGRRSARC